MSALPKSRALTLALMAPAALLLAAGFVLPLAEMTMISFFRYSSLTIWEPVFTLDNYLQFVKPFNMAAMVRTLWLSAVVTAFCVILGYPVAYYLARSESRWKALHMFALLSPLMMSSVVLVLGWQMLLGRTGPVIGLLGMVGISTKILGTQAAIIVGLTALQLPFMVMLLRSAIERIPPSVEEAASILGAGRAHTFFKVVVPLSRSGLISGCLLVYAMGLGSLVAPALLGSSRDVMIGNVIYESIMVSLNWPFAAAVSLVLLVATMILMTGYLLILRKSDGATR